MIKILFPTWSFINLKSPDSFLAIFWRCFLIFLLCFLTPCSCCVNNLMNRRYSKIKRTPFSQSTTFDPNLSTVSFYNSFTYGHTKSTTIEIMTGFISLIELRKNFRNLLLCHADSSIAYRDCN